MSDTKTRRKPLRKVPSIAEGEDQEWYGAEAHVPYQDRPIDWLRPFRTDGAGFTGVAVSLAFLGGTLLGSLLFASLRRKDRV